MQSKTSRITGARRAPLRECCDRSPVESVQGNRKIFVLKAKIQRPSRPLFRVVFEQDTETAVPLREVESAGEHSVELFQRGCAAKKAVSRTSDIESTVFDSCVHVRVNRILLDRQAVWDIPAVKSAKRFIKTVLCRMGHFLPPKAGFRDDRRSNTDMRNTLWYNRCRTVPPERRTRSLSYVSSRDFESLIITNVRERFFFCVFGGITGVG